MEETAEIPQVVQMKAGQLVSKFLPYVHARRESGTPQYEAEMAHAKRCALLCVEEVMDNDQRLSYTGFDKRSTDFGMAHDYWQAVKEAIPHV